MTTEKWLKEAAARLEQAGIATARLDCLVLLEDAIDKSRAWLLAHPEHIVQGPTLERLNAQVGRRVKHEPLAYIRGKGEFYGREFLVTPATLQPRSETETMIDLLGKIIGNIQETINKELRIIDVGTGSGCIAVTAKLEWPKAEVYATEINGDALKIAWKNAKKLGAKVNFYEGNLLDPISALHPLHSAPFAILANLPYVPSSHTINQAAMQEPKIAIFGGRDGLDLYRELFAMVPKNATNLQFILTESLPFQHAALCQIAKEAGYKQTAEEDFIQQFEKSN